MMIFVHVIMIAGIALIAGSVGFVIGFSQRCKIGDFRG